MNKMPPGSHFNSDSDLESVISTHEQQQKKRRNSAGPKYFCTIAGCQAVFKRLDQLDRHEYKHTGIKKHACTYEGCDKSYTIVTHLKRHLRCTHERAEAQIKTVPCSVENCDKMFPNHSNMERHVREVHENPKVYHCKHCGEKFKQRLKMRRHEVVKHTKDYPYNCEKCHKGFHLEWLYERHICKVYPCSDCTLEFSKWSAYLGHCKQTQHGRKYYKCEHCDRIYPKPGELEHHITAKHADDKLKVIYRCQHENCERAYIYRRNLMQHERTAHEGRRYKCTASEDCRSSFNSVQNLQKHVERDHAEGDAAKAKQPKKAATVRKQRKKRKDAGGSVLSNLAKLSSVAVSRELDKQLRVREWTAMNEASEKLEQTQCEPATDEDEAEQDDELEMIDEDNVPYDENSHAAVDGEDAHKVKILNVEVLNLNDAIKSKLVEAVNENNGSQVEEMELDALIAEVLTNE